MSWQLGSVLVVCAALAGGFAWFERSRPSSKVVAAIAALAALAVAGRVLFAPIPNVQATTDVAFLSGFTLGAGPGFVVGSLAALVSNVFLGQGPWTPWQMLGWGATGVAGAVLARVAGRQLGRLPLSVSCGLAGLVFGAWMDLSQLVMYAAEASPETYIAISVTSLPFNVAHAAGNFVLCMLLGPGFVRLLGRFRARLEVSWTVRRRAPASVGAIVTKSCVLALVVFGLSATVASARGSSDAVRYLVRAQNPDGGFGGAPGQSSSQLMTGWTALGLEAAGRNPLDISRSGRTPIDYMRSKATQLRDSGELERSILALRGAGRSARRFAGRDLVRELERKQRDDGSFERQAPTTAFAVMALRAAGRHRRSRSVQQAMAWLVAQQNPDGGFSNGARGGASDVDDTGAVLQGLAAGGRNDGRMIDRAIAFLRRAQNRDGGLGQFDASRSNAQSSAWAAQGLRAAGRSPRSFRPRGARSLTAFLESLQQADGSFRYSRTSAQTPVWVTAQVLAAVEGKPFPLRPVRRSARVEPTATAARARHGSRGGARAALAGRAGAGPASAVSVAASRDALVAPIRDVKPAAARQRQPAAEGSPDRRVYALGSAAALALMAALGLALRRRLGR
ncbi:MAG: prenyltransferase/squalene oxidase repeat-containing protein [Phycisphaeraceae bacterium]